MSVATREPIVPQPRPIRARDNRTGATVMLVPSATVDGKFHVVDPKTGTCDCKGYSYRKSCRHIAPQGPRTDLRDGGQAHLQVKRASGEWPSVPAHVTEMAATYHGIIGAEDE